MASQPALILRPSRRVILRLFACSAALFAVGASTAVGSARLYLQRDSGWLHLLILAVLACVAAIISAVVAIATAKPGRVFLRLDPAGFTQSTWLRSEFVPWSDVRRFRVVRVGKSEMVGLEFFERAARAHSRLLLTANRAMGQGCDGAISQVYAMPPEELAHLMNAWLSKSALAQIKTQGDNRP